MSTTDKLTKPAQASHRIWLALIKSVHLCQHILRNVKGLSFWEMLFWGVSLVCLLLFLILNMPLRNYPCWYFEFLRKVIGFLL